MIDQSYPSVSFLIHASVPLEASVLTFDAIAPNDHTPRTMDSGRFIFMGNHSV